MKPRKVAMIEPVGGHRGNELFPYNLCNGLQQAAYYTTLYTCDETNFDFFHKPLFDVKKFYKKIYGKAPQLIRGLRYAEGAFRTVTDCQKQKTDIAHLHIYHFANREYLNQYLLKKKKIRTVLTVHDVEDFVRYGQSHSMSKYLRFEKLNPHSIVLSTYAKERILNYFPNTPESNIHVIPVTDKDTLYYNPKRSKREARQALGLSQDDFIVMFFGQIKKVKGLDILINGFAQSLKGKADVRLLIAGIPWKVGFDEFKKQIQQTGIASQTTLHLQYHSNEIKPDYFIAADLVVLPYREIFSSGVLVNALHYGSAVICSDLPFFKEYVHHQYNCLMFETEKATSLAEQLTYAYQNQAVLEQLKKAARNIADTVFSIEHIIRQTTDVYEQVLRET